MGTVMAVLGVFLLALVMAVGMIALIGIAFGAGKQEGRRECEAEQKQAGQG